MLVLLFIDSLGGATLALTQSNKGSFAMLPMAKPMAFSKVPIIDLAPLQKGDRDSRKAVADEMVKVSGEVGFFYIINHDIPADAVNRMYDAAHRFFALPLEDKLAISITKSNTYRGYLPLDMKGADSRIEPNLQEAFQIFQELSADDPDVRTEKPLHGLNLWPKAMPELRSEMLDYYGKLQGLAYRLLPLFALGLGLPETTFERFFRKPMMQLRLLHYPPQNPSDKTLKMGTRPHTDAGAFTILAQDSTGGLEAMNRDQEWVSVPPIDGSYVINIGEMMKVWTDGLFSSTPHRVINRYGVERYSVPFFTIPDFDARIAPIVANPRPDDAPTFLTSVARNVNKTCGEILAPHYGRIWPSARSVATA